MLNQKGFTHIVIGIISFVAAALILIGAWWFLFGQSDETNTNVNTNTKTITSFDECIAAGYPAIESYPRQCSDGNNTFTEVINKTIDTVSKECVVDEDCTFVFKTIDINNEMNICCGMPSCVSFEDDRWISLNKESYISFYADVKSQYDCDSIVCPLTEACLLTNEDKHYEAQCIDGQCSKVKEASAINTNTVVIDSSGTDDWQTYTNSVYGYTLNYPPNWDIIEMSTNENVYWTDETGQSTLSTRIRSEYPTWFDNSADSVITLGGLTGNRFIYQYCDGPSCGPTTVADVIPVSEQYLGLEFPGDTIINVTEEEVRSSFQFIE
ncbi:hypothetical protein KKA01_03220 [Patescibacteria group bacterium]|nr:hypothetical protein [Patescibacteria group bacterium]